MMSDARLHSPACERNRDPILRVLEEVLPREGLVLEIASGTGMHGVWFAPRLPDITWQPSDQDQGALASIEAWRHVEPADNLRPPLALDVTARPWPIERADAIFNANMIHISPWEICLALFEGASQVLGPGAPLILYGPFVVDGEHTAPSNEAFDRSLRARDARWGVRDLGDVEQVARAHGFVKERVFDMPANNLVVVLRCLSRR
jgi:hypothetical protein